MVVQLSAQWLRGQDEKGERPLFEYRPPTLLYVTRGELLQKWDGVSTSVIRPIHVKCVVKSGASFIVFWGEIFACKCLDDSMSYSQNK